MRTLRYYSAAATCVVFGYIVWEVVELWLAPSEPKLDALPKLLTALVITAMAAYQIHKNHPQFMALVFAIGAPLALPVHAKICGALPLTLLILQAIGQREEPFAKRFGVDPPELIDPDAKRLQFGLNFLFLVVQYLVWRNLPDSIRPLSPADSGYWMLLSLPIANATTWFVHEIGHALMGFLVGYKLVRVESYPFKLERYGSRLKLKVDWNWKKAGEYFGTPTRFSYLPVREVLVVGGGLAAGLLLVVACWQFLYRTSGQLSGALYALISVTASASLVTNLFNLWPPGIFGQKVDGTTLWNYLKGSPKFDLRIAFRGCLSSRHTQLRPKDWNSEWLDSLRLDVGDSTTADYLLCSAIDRLDASPNDSQARADLEKAIATIRATELPREATNAEIRRAQSLRCIFDGVRPEPNIFDRISDEDRSAEFSIALFTACFAACDADNLTALQKLEEAARWLQSNIECGFDEETLAELRLFRAKIESGTFVSARHPHSTAPQASPPERSA